MRGFRGRLVVTLVALVALTAAFLGTAAYLFVAQTLRDELRANAVQQVNLNVGVLARERLSDRPTREELEESGLVEAFRLRSRAETVVDFGDGRPFVSGLALAGAIELVSPELRQLVREGQVAFQSLELEGDPYLVVAARRPPAGPAFYFFFPAAQVEEPLARLAQALLVGSVVLVLLAALAAGTVARGVLRPVRRASRAASDVARGELSARIPVESRDEFGTWAASFNRMAASLEHTVWQLREAQARQRRFVADVSHKLRTPLTALVNEATMARDALERLGPDARRLGELLVGDVARLRVLVEDLMEISRFDASAEEPHPVEFDLAPFLAAVVAARLPHARLRLADRSLRGRTDPRRLERILGNLLDNAREHAGAADVEVSCRAESDGLLITVEDRGPGVAPEKLARIFDRFYKAEPSRSAGSSGLGLAIARENAVLLGGSLSASLRAGGGMRFELRLPVTPPLPASDVDVMERAQPVARHEARAPRLETGKEPSP